MSVTRDGKPTQSEVTSKPQQGIADVDRIKLRGGFNFREFLEKGEASFTVDENALGPVLEESSDLKATEDNFFQNCSLKNVEVDAVTEEDSKILLCDFDSLANRMMAITDDGELKKLVEKPGIGQKPPPNAKVWINYSVICEDVDEAVDSTFKKDRLFTFKLGNGEVLPALEYGVATMELNERSKFLAEASYAYGPLGLPNRVPPNCRALFTVDLVDFQEATAVNAVFKMNAEERSHVDFEEIYKAANEMKTVGNKFWLGHDWRAAINKYRKGVHMMDRYLTIDNEVDKKRNGLLFVLYNNLAQCYLRTNENDKVISMCLHALDLPEKTTEGNRCKAFYRKAKAEFELGKYEDSKNSLKEALILEPSNPDALSLLDQIATRMTEEEKAERKLLKRMSAGITEN